MASRVSTAGNLVGLTFANRLCCSVGEHVVGTTAQLSGQGWCCPACHVTAYGSSPGSCPAMRAVPGCRPCNRAAETAGSIAAAVPPDPSEARWSPVRAVQLGPVQRVGNYPVALR